MLVLRAHVNVSELSVRATISRFYVSVRGIGGNLKFSISLVMNEANFNKGFYGTYIFSIHKRYISFET